jgi:hypothetical protein
MTSSTYYEIKRAVEALIGEMKLAGADTFDPPPYFEALRALVASLPKEWDSHVQRLYHSIDHPVAEDVVEATVMDVVETTDRDAESCYMTIQRLALNIRVMQLLKDSRKFQ